MKKRLLFIFIGISFVIVIFYFLRPSQKSYKGFDATTYTIENKTYTLLVADNEAKWTRGLMNVEKKPEGIDGMIFLFPKKQHLSFWNMNTDLDLNLVWLDGEKKIGTSFLPSIKRSKDIVTVSSPRPADKVIEFFAD